LQELLAVGRIDIGMLEMRAAGKTTSAYAMLSVIATSMPDNE